MEPLPQKPPSSEDSCRRPLGPRRAPSWVQWGMVAAALLGLSALLGAAYWYQATVVGPGTRTASEGLKWQAQLGARAYVPGQRGLVSLGSQADLLARYLSANAVEVRARDHMRLLSTRIESAHVFSQSWTWGAGFVEYLVREQRIILTPQGQSRMRLTGLITIWVNQGPSGRWAVTGLSYDFNPLGSPYVPPSISYTRTLLGPEPSVPQGV